MASRSDGDPEGWVALACPGCQARMRIRREYAHLRGRCPECGLRIEPREPPPPAPAVFSDADEPLGLVPLAEEEWPEPPRLDRSDEAEEPYRIAGLPEAVQPFPPSPASWLPLPPEESPTESYSVADDEAPLTSHSPPVVGSAAEPESTPYETIPPPPTIPIPPEPVPIFLGEKERRPAPLPPARALWQGVYTFPWQPGNLSVWLFMGLNFTILALASTALAGLILQGGIFLLFVPPVIAGVAIVAFWAGGDASDKFLVALEATAGGGDRIAWGARAGIFEAMGRFFYLLWVLATSALVPFLFVMVFLDGLPRSPVEWLIVSALWSVILPLMLFSSLAAPSPWIVIHPPTMLALLRRPGSLVILCGVQLLFLAGFGWLAGEAVSGARFWLAPVLGFVSAALVLIYARLLGRVGWLLTGTDLRRARRRRRQALESTGPVLPTGIGSDPPASGPTP